MLCTYSTMGAVPGCVPGCLHDDTLYTQATNTTLLSVFHITTLAGRKELLIPSIPVSKSLSLAPHLGHEYQHPRCFLISQRGVSSQVT